MLVTNSKYSVFQVNVSGERRMPQRQRHKWRRVFAEVWPNSHMLPSWTFSQIFWRNFGCRYYTFSIFSNLS